MSKESTDNVSLETKKTVFESNASLMKRASLLERIESLRRLQTDPTGSKAGAKLSTLMEEYNQLMEGYLLHQLGLRVDPYKRLPLELFVGIVALATSIGYSPNIDKVLVLTLVSHSWKMAILSTSSLWSNILISARINDCNAKIQTALVLSQSSPLTLYIDSTWAWQQTEPIIYPHYARVTSLRIAKSKPNDNQDEIFSRLGPFIHLKSVGFDDLYRITASNEVIRFIESNTSIERVTGLLLTRELLHAEARGVIASIYSRMRPSAVLPYVETMPVLENFTLLGPGPISPRYHSDDGAEYTPNFPLIWRTYVDFGKLSIPVLNLAASSLVKLVLHICICDARPLFMTLCNLSVLYELHLYLEIGGAHRFNTEPISPASCTARILLLRLEDSPTRSSAQQRAKLEEWYDSFVNVVSSIFTRIQRLSLSTSVPTDILRNIIQSGLGENLETLTVDCAFSQSLGPVQVPSSLQALAIYHGACGNSLNLRSQTVKMLHVKSSSPATHQFIRSEQWPAFISLEVVVSSYTLDLSKGQFCNLRNLSLTGLYVSSKAKMAITRFCRDLALNMYTVPCLEALALDDAPEWDILFILLERYNFRTEVGSTRIADLHIRGVPSWLILPLKQLCEGKFADRPSNHELSWVGNIDAILDTSM
ncbi:hypothetical protein FRC17_000606 [Serendipita sp. 399]|nr:hypothetical protein FRC17_000606 [Serendipita sp. 399]